MNREEYMDRILLQRELMKGYTKNEEDVQSDQNEKLPQPPLEKGAISSKIIPLTKDFDNVIKNNNFLEILNNRVSRRNYSKEALSLVELSFLLWATQGVKKVIGKERKATMRTVPSAGARHPFETYVFVNNVEGLEAGLYHYIALEHTLEFVQTINDQVDSLSIATFGQVFYANAPVAFAWTVMPYRTEWRYTVKAHKYALIDIGHVCENLYFACEALGLGTCAIGAYDQEAFDGLLNLDSKPSSDKNAEFVVYAASVGHYQ